MTDNKTITPKDVRLEYKKMRTLQQDVFKARRARKIAVKKFEGIAQRLNQEAADVGADPARYLEKMGGDDLKAVRDAEDALEKAEEALKDQFMKVDELKLIILIENKDPYWVGD